MHTLQMKGSGRRVAAGLVAVALLIWPMLALAAPQASVVMDARSGEILFARNHDTRLHPASLTKMMTLYIAFEAVRNGEIGLDTPVRISANAAGTPCSCLGVRAGQTVALRHLIRAAAIRSGNDAATAIGEAISGSEAAFIDRMNRTARALGMTNTTFRNAHGLTAPGHLSTARDMTILGRQLYFDYPEYWNLWSRRSADAGIAQVRNTNTRFLDGYRGADGIKTGFTRAAGFNLTASAERDGKRIIVTVFGGQSVPDRTRRVVELMDMGFNRAPARVSVRRPPPPNYGSQPPGGVAMAAAASGERPAAGRTIRLETAVRRSPVPPARPLPATHGVAEGLPDGVAEAVSESVLAALAAPEEEPAEPAVLAAAEPAVPETVAPPPPRPELPFDLAEADAPDAASGTAVAEAVEELVEEAEDAERPFALAGIEASESGLERPFAVTEPDSADGSEPALAGLDGAGEADAASELAVAQAPVPPQRPEDLVPEAPEMVAEAEADPETPGRLTLLAATAAGPPASAAAESAEARAAVAAAVAPQPAPAAGGPAAGTVQMAGLIPPATTPRRKVQAQPPEPREPVALGPEAAVVLTFSTPAEGVEMPRLAALAEVGWAEPAAGPLTAHARAGTVTDAPAVAPAGEVIERQLSTSEPRMWRVSLGRHGTRDAAERALMRAALSEMAALEGALRRVERVQGGFEAQFVGLTPAQAESACLRMRARDRECATLAP